MRTAILAGAVVLAVASGAAAETRTVAVTDISALSVSGRFSVEVAQGPRASAVLEGAATDIDRLGVRVERGSLRVWERCTVFCGNRDLDVTLKVVAPAVSAIRADKGVAVRARAITAENMEIDVSMGGSLEIDGRCRALTAEATMGGALDATSFICADVEADAGMGGAASVHAARSLKAEASMGGAVSVAGSPQRRDASAMMGGVIDVD